MIRSRGMWAAGVVTIALSACVSQWPMGPGGYSKAVVPAKPGSCHALIPLQPASYWIADFSDPRGHGVPVTFKVLESGDLDLASSTADLSLQHEVSMSLRSHDESATRSCFAAGLYTPTDHGCQAVMAHNDYTEKSGEVYDALRQAVEAHNEAQLRHSVEFPFFAERTCGLEYPNSDRSVTCCQ